MTTPTRVQFVVYGVPAPQGGSKPVPTRRGTRLVSTGGVGLEAWRNSCASSALAAATEHGTFDGPIKVQATFRFPMPKSRRKWERDLGEIWKTTTPDLDKLERALGDSLKAGGLIVDDSIICQWSATKVEVHQQWTGVVVLIKSLLIDEDEDL